MDIIDETISAAYICSYWKSSLALISIWPRPPSPPTKKSSETMAPITAMPAEMRSPANSEGSADGRPALSRVTPQDAPCNRNRSRMPGSRLFSPSSRVVGTAKNVNSATISTFGRKPKPSSACSSGMIARIGIDWSATR